MWYTLIKIDVICQIVIPLAAATTVSLLVRKDKWVRWGYISGMSSQPFYLFSTAYHHQWGMFAGAVYFTIQWGIGIWNHWIMVTESKCVICGTLTKNKVKRKFVCSVDCMGG